MPSAEIVKTDAKPYFSATQLEMLSRCPEQYRRRYVEGEKLPPGIAALTGTGFHGGAKTNMAQKVESRRDLPAEQIVEAAAAAFDAAKAGAFALTAEEASRGAKIVLGEALDLTVALARVHAKEQAPDYQPVLVEEKVKIEMPDCTHDLLGILDLADDRRRVVDFKTAAKKKNQAEADASLQLTIYAVLHHARTGSPASEVRLDTLVKNKEISRQLLTSERGPDDYAALAERIEAASALLKAGVFLPASPGSWQCSAKFCGFHATCRFIPENKRGKE